METVPLGRQSSLLNIQPACNQVVWFVVTILLLLIPFQLVEAQSDELETAKRLNAQVSQLFYQAGKAREAIPLAQQLLAIREKVLGPEHPETATALNTLGSLYHSVGEYEEARPLMLRVLAIREKVLGMEHPDTARSLRNLAEIYRVTGAHADAEPLFQRALAINEKVLGPEHPNTVQVLNGFAGLYHAIGKYGQAKLMLQRALAIRKKTLGPEHPDTIPSLNNLAELYRVTGAYAEAEPLYQRALAISEKVLGPEHPNTASALNNLAVLYQSTGAYGKAESLHQRALMIRERILGPEHPDTAMSLGNLAAIYGSIGSNAQAESLHQRALAIHEKVLGPEHPITTSSMNNLGSYYLEMGAYTQAEPLLKRALAISEKVLGPEHPDTAVSLNNLAELYNKTGAYAQVEPLLKRALSITEKVLGPEHPDTAGSLNNLAELYEDTGAYEQATPLMQRALAIREKVLGLEHPATAKSLNNVAALSWRQNRWTDAYTQFQRAMHIQNLNARRELVQGNDGRKRSYMATLEGSTHKVVSFAQAASLQAPASIKLGLETVLQRKGLVLDVLTDNLARLRKSVSLEDQALLASYQTAATQWATVSMRGPGTMSIEQYRSLQADLQRDVKTLEAQLSSHSSRFRDQVQPLTIQQVQQALSPKAVLLEWIRFDSFNSKATRQERQWGAARYAVFLLKSSGDPVLVDVGEAQPIETLMTDLLTALRRPGQQQAVALSAKELGRLLLQPLRPHFGAAQQLFIAPDGQLNLIPFGVLQDAQGGTLLDEYELTYVTSGRDLLSSHSSSKVSNSTLVFADPDFGPFGSEGASKKISSNRSVDYDRAGFRFEALPGTRQEAEALRTLLKLPPSQVLTQQNATETALKQVHGPRLLHLATHGFFLNDLSVDLNASARSVRAVALDESSRPPVVQGENPLLRSGLALAGANQVRSGADDGILTALEAANLDLQGTQLVVLSACETGVGQVHNGEGVYGLRRALVLAGVQTQVASLWKVDDAATTEFMVAYYRHLQAGLGRSAALRAVQRSMKENPKRAHPYYWAAFVVIGDASPLPGEHISPTAMVPK
ncbi:MAG: tetratricopeptide repeat protein [Nitrospira sp.]